MGLQRITDGEEPVDLETAKRHVREASDDDDQHVLLLLSAARRFVEDMTVRQFAPATWRLTLDRFPAGSEAIELERCPVQSIESIEYVDADGDTVEWDGYQLDKTVEPARIRPAANESWPATLAGQLNAVEITFAAGYAEGQTPELAQQAILLLFAHWYENRESIGQVGAAIAHSLDALLWSLRWGL